MLFHVLYALRPFVKSERGATMVEYGILVALIAVVSIAVIGALGLNVFDAFDFAQKEVEPIGPKAPG